MCTSKENRDLTGINWDRPEQGEHQAEANDFWVRVEELHLSCAASPAEDKVCMLPSAAAGLDDLHLGKKKLSWGLFQG